MLNTSEIFLFLFFVILIILLFRLRKIFLKKPIKKKDKYYFLFVLHFSKHLVFYLTLCFLSIIILGLNLPHKIQELLEKSIFILLLISLIFPVLKALNFLVNDLLDKFDHELASMSIFRNLVKVICVLLLGLIVLSCLKISLTPILATLGVGGVTIALAVKDSVANFFSGFYLITYKQLKIDDFIELDSGEKGFVIDINARNTEIKALNDTMILIPNSKIIDSKITNYNLPTKEMNFVVEVGIHYDSDLNFIEKIAQEIAKQTLNESEFAVQNFEPIIRFNTFGSSNISMSVVLRTTEYVGHFLLKHAFIKKLHDRFKIEKIKIPFQIIEINNFNQK